MIFSDVDIFGYEPLLATVNFTTHVVFLRGDTNRPFEIEHGPDSLHVFFPFEGVDKIAVSVVRDPRVTVVRRTVKPGVAATDCGVTD